MDSEILSELNCSTSSLQYNVQEDQASEEIKQNYNIDSLLKYSYINDDWFQKF